VYVEDDEYIPDAHENMEEDGDDEDMQIDEHAPSGDDDNDESLLLLVKDITLGRLPDDETDSVTSAEDTDYMSEEDTSDEEFLYDPSDDKFESTRGVSALDPQEATDIRYRE
jgi:hypothetical protein